MVGKKALNKTTSWTPWSREERRLGRRSNHWRQGRVVTVYTGLRDSGSKSWQVREREAYHSNLRDLMTHKARAAGKPPLAAGTL